MTVRLALWAGLLAGGFAIGWVVAGWKHDAALARAQSRLDALAESRRASLARINQLEEEVQANAFLDPVIVERCLGPSRVRRLNLIND